MNELEKLELEKGKIESIMILLDKMSVLPEGLTLGDTLKVIHTVNLYQGNLGSRIAELQGTSDGQ